MILITTSDYLPKLGGLTSFVLNIERVLKKCNLQFDIFHWSSADDLIHYDKKLLNKYQLIINIHPMFSWFVDGSESKMINFVHGSEILMNSPNPLKAVLKKINSKKYFSQMEKCKFNLFISDYTLKKAGEKGFNINYARDIVFHNCIDTTKSFYHHRALDFENLKFCCIARNVPHKNILGTIKILEDLAQKKKTKITLWLPKGTSFKSNLIKISELENDSDNCRDEVYKNVHYNLLFSLDHSKKGFIEGFGLTVLEAACFGTPSIVFSTGGLTESVHHLKTGIILSGKGECTPLEISQIFDTELYLNISKISYEHTLSSHSLSEYEKLFKALVFQGKVA